MDWVDYKRIVIKYREVYFDGHKHVHHLFAHVLESYSLYRSVSIEGAQEWMCVEKYGEFLYYLAELENMVSRREYDKITVEDNEWGMIANGCGAIRKYQRGKITGDELCVNAMQWIRAYFPIVYMSRLYEPAIIQSVYDLQQKNGY